MESEGKLMSKKLPKTGREVAAFVEMVKCMVDNETRIVNTGVIEYKGNYYTLIAEVRKERKENVKEK